jgi:hypothetical protein
MRDLKKKWCREEGSIDFIQLFVGLLIISIAAVGTLQSLYYGYEQLDQQMRHKKALSVARSYVEYIQGRIHTDFDPASIEGQSLLNGNMGRDGEEVLLDRMDPDNSYDDIKCRVMHGPIVPFDDPLTGIGYDYYKIRVIVRWHEPEEKGNKYLHEVFLEARMVEAGA